MRTINAIHALEAENPKKNKANIPRDFDAETATLIL
jgi:hypothetical protein